MALQYDNRQKTRVFQREQPDTAETHAFDERIGFTQPLTKPKGMFDGISIAQVIAGAAAAATSMLLASKIGIAGSVIGAAVSSAVTVICSQLYRHALEKSAEKLKLDQYGLGPNGASSHGASSGYGIGGPYQAGGVQAGASGHRTRIAPADLRKRAAAEHQTTQRKVIVISVILAAVAVVLTAGIIFLGTAGEGLGTKPAPLLPTPVQQPADTTSTPDAAQNATPETSTGGQDSNGQSAHTGETGSETDGNQSSTSESQEQAPAPSQGNSEQSGNGNGGSSGDEATSPDASAGHESGGNSGMGGGSDNTGTSTGTNTANN